MFRLCNKTHIELSDTTAHVSQALHLPPCPRGGLSTGGYWTQVLVNVRDVSEARFHESVKLGEVLCARSIEAFEGRWRLRWMRANGYGN
jgi:hypothetical protein